VLNGLYAFHLVRAEYRLAKGVAAQILDLAATSGKTEHRMVGHRAMGAVQLHLGNLSDAKRHLEQAWALYDFDQHSQLAYVYGTDHAAITSAFLGTCYCLMGRHQDALQVQNTALEWSKNLKHAHSVAQILVYMCKVHLLARDIPALQRDVKALSEVAEEHSLPFMATIARLWESWAKATTTSEVEHIEDLRQASEDWWSVGAGNYKTFFPSLIAEIQTNAGHHDAAHQTLTHARNVLSKTEEKWAEADQLRIEAALVAKPGGDPVPLLLRAIETAQRQGARLYELRAAVALAEWRQHRGEPVGEALNSVMSHFHQDAQLPYLKDARALMETIT
jgi:predicted ATPase